MWPFTRKSRSVEINKSALAPHPLWQPQLRSVGYSRTLSGNMPGVVASNTVASACVNLISAQVSAARLRPADNASIDDAHRAQIAKLLRRPNEQVESGAEFLFQVCQSLAVHGEAFIKADRDLSKFRNGRPTLKSLEVLRADRVELTTDQHGEVVTGYRHTSGGVARTLPLNDVCHLKLSTVSNRLRGMPPLAPAMSAIEIYSAINVLGATVARQGGTPSCVLEVKDRENGSPINDDEFEAFTSYLKRFWQSGDREGTIALVNVPIEVHELPRAADLISHEAQESARAEICAALGVPSILLRPGENATYANQREARVSLWAQTVRPMYFEPIRQALSELFGCDIVADLSHVQAVAEQQALEMESLAKCDFMSINEKRHRLGLAPVEHGDTILVSSGKIALDMVADPDGDGDPDFDPNDTEPEDILQGWLRDEAKAKRARQVEDDFAEAAHTLNRLCDH